MSASRTRALREAGARVARAGYLDRGLTLSIDCARCRRRVDVDYRPAFGTKRAVLVSGLALHLEDCEGEDSSQTPLTESSHLWHDEDMSNNVIERLPTFTFDQLALVYQRFNEAAVAAPRGSRSAAIAMGRRAKVAAEVSRRGRVIRKSLAGPHYFVMTHEEAAAYWR